MALHRDIFWVGKQWAVTGYGIQACDQRKKGKFDIEAVRLWEDGVLESLYAEPWFNREDFDKAIAAARKHYPEPPGKAAVRIEATPRVEAALLIPLIESGPRVVAPSPPVEPAKPPPQPFDMRIDSGSAKFLKLWRIRVRR